MNISLLRNFAVAVSMAAASVCSAQNDIKLPQPDKTLKTTLIDALQNRHSVRDFTEKDFSNQDLATLLWAANGINREDGKRTAPSALNKQDVEIFVIRKDGAYYWNAQTNTLELRSNQDLRSAVARGQEFVAKAPLSLVLVSNGAKFGNMPNKFGLADASYVSQNICLICSAAGWACCPRATMDNETLAEQLKLTPKQVPMLNNTVGYSKSAK